LTWGGGRGGTNFDCKNICNKIKPNFREDAMVADLIEDNPVQWNKSYIFQIFGEEEAIAISH
jgi:hypothetical protein